MAIKKSFFKKKTKWTIAGAVVVLILSLLPFCKENIFEYFDDSESDSRQLTLQDLKQSDGLKGVAEAAGGLPWQFGGTVTFYQPLCTVDNQSGTCPSSCPMCTQMLGQACNGYQEIQYTPALGSMPSSPPGTVCAPKGFQFKGGIPPRPGAEILGGGASPQLPWVIGVSSY
jgi:hypothetical protein